MRKLGMLLMFLSLCVFTVGCGQNGTKSGTKTPAASGSTDKGGTSGTDEKTPAEKTGGATEEKTES